MKMVQGKSDERERDVKEDEVIQSSRLGVAGAADYRINGTRATSGGDLY